MSGFALLSVTPHLLEKIINKVRGKNYFRLQQTCREVYDFISNSSKISIGLDGIYYVTDEPDGCLRLKSDGVTIVFDELRTVENVTLEAFRGIRLEVFKITEPYKAVDFDLLYDSLKNYHITCHKLSFRTVVWTNEQCLALLNIMKPHSIEANNSIYYTSGHGNVLIPRDRTDRYEILLQSNTLKTVDVQLAAHNVILATEQLLSKFRFLTVNVNIQEKPFSLLHKILEILATKAQRNLAYFYFHVNGMWGNITEDELRLEFGDMEWETRGIWTTGYLDLSQHFPHHVTCELTFALEYYSPSAKINFMHWEKPPVK